MNDLAGVALFEGIDDQIVSALVARLPVRHFEPGEYLCRAGDAGSSMFILRSGLAEVIVGEDGSRVDRLRRGDVVGEMSLLTDEPRTASVVASVATEVLELDREAFTTVLGDHPELLGNLTRILSARLARTTRSHVDRRGRGEAVTLVFGEGLDALADSAVEAARAACPRPVAMLDVRKVDGVSEPLESLLGELDDLLGNNSTVVVVASAGFAQLEMLALHDDRTIVLARYGEVAAVIERLGEQTENAEVVLVDRPVSVPALRGAMLDGIATLRSLDEGSERDIRWLGRHISRTKLGLALGAGGAKGYAHVGALRVLEEAGYEIDTVSGSSIGAIVGTCIGMGMGSSQIEEAMRDLFTPENTKAMFNLSFSGQSTGGATMQSMLEALCGSRVFDDLDLPVVVMTVDLDAKEPQPLSDGPLLDALLAATALAGFVPPFKRGDQRLIDALALVPVPSDAARGCGADIVVSVNIMSRQQLDSWPGQAPPEPSEKRERMLDVLLEVMDLAQLDSSARHAALADVVVTPRFGPATWRDFELADLFLEAGREAATAQLGALAQLATPLKA